MAEGLHEGELHRGMPLETYGYYARLHFEALTTGNYMAQSWKRPVRHNRGIERAALWCALQLEPGCRGIVSGELPMPSPAIAPLESRYELQAAARTVVALFPFTFEERDMLRPPDISPNPHEESDTLRPPEVSPNPRFEDTSKLGNPELFERWHQWLWLDDHGTPQSNVEALGASALFAEGCSRLYDILSPILYPTDRN